MATDHNFKVKNGLTVEAGNIQAGHDGTYGESGTGRYVTVGFGGVSNGSNRVFAHNTGGDGIYLASATGRHVHIRTNGSGNNTFRFSSSGEFQMGSSNTTVIDSSRNLTNIGTISSGQITATNAVLTDTSTNGRGIYRNSRGYDLRLGGGTNNTNGAYISLSGDQRGGTASSYNGRLEYHTGGVDAANASSVLGDHVWYADYNGGSTHLMTLDSVTGYLNVKVGGYQINGTTVIDSNRNLTNIGTITSSSGTVGTSPNILKITTSTEANTAQGDVYAALEFHVTGAENSTGTLSNSAVSAIKAIDYRSGSTSFEDSGIGFYTLDSDESAPVFRGGFSNAGGFFVADDGVVDNNTAQGDIYAVGNITAGNNLQFNDSLKFGSTVLIDTAGELKNINTISIPDGDFVLVDGQNSPGSETNIIWRDHSADRLYLGTTTDVVEFRGNVNFQSGHTLSYNGNTILDASRNLGNIGTISSGAITASGSSVFNPTSDMIIVNEPSTNTDLQTIMRVGTSSGGLYLTGSNAIIGKGAYYDGGWIATATAGSSIDFAANDRITFNTFSGATVGGAAAFGSRAYIDASGLNVTGTISSGGQVSGTSLQARNDSGYGTIEVGGSSGGFIDLKKPATDDYDVRIVSDAGTGGRIQSNGVFDIDAAGDITLDADGGDIHLKDNGSSMASFTTSAATFPGKTNIAASTSTSSSSSLKLHVGTINNTGSSAIAQFGGFIRASEYYILHASTGSTDSLFIDYVGDDMDITAGEGTYSGVLRANGYKVGTTTVIGTGRLVQNVDLKAGNSGARFKNDNWFYDTAAKERIYFHSSNNYYKTASTGGSHIWRVSGDYEVMSLNSGGDLTIPGDFQAENATFTGTGDVTVKIIADTDNVTETDNPTLGFSQDGNTAGTQFVLGLESNNDVAFPGSKVNSPYIHANVNSPSHPLSIANNGKLVAQFDSTSTNAALTVTKFSNITGTNGSTILNLKNYMGSSTTNGDLSQQKSFIDFQMLDSNGNEVPQVRIGAEVGEGGDANSQTLEGSGAFVVYTNDAESTSGDAGASLTEKFRVAHDGTSTFTNNVVIGGNLTVNGTQTTLNTATLQVEDKNIVLNYGTGDTSGSADGAGITIQDAVNSSTDATMNWNGTSNRFDFSHKVNAAGDISGYDIYGQDHYVLNSAGNGWHEWATRSDDRVNLSVHDVSANGTITVSSGASSKITLTNSSDSNYNVELRTAYDYDGFFRVVDGGGVVRFAVGRDNHAYLGGTGGGGGNKVFHDGYHPDADNADTVDNLHASQFLRSDADDTWSGNISTTSTNGIRFGSSNQTDTNDGFIAAGRFGTGLNIVGTQTSSGTGRQVRIWGDLIDSAGNAFVKNSQNISSYSITVGTTTDSSKIIFPDKDVADNPTATGHKRQLISMGNSGNGGMWQTTGRGGLMLASADDSLILASGDVGRGHDPDAGGWNPNPDDENIYLLTDSNVIFRTNLQTTSAYKEMSFDANGDLAVSRNISASGSLQTAGTTRIDSSGNLTNIGTITASGNVQHTGLTMTSGTDIDQLYTVTDSLTLTTSYQDTSINSSELSTGTYIMQLYINQDHSVGGSHYNEYYSGVISWYGSSTNSSEVDEIVLHRAGHAPNSSVINLRTQRHPNGGDNLVLQIKANYNMTAARNYVFKFRRMI